MVKSKIIILVLIVLNSTIIFSQDIRQDWKKLKPLETAKSEIDQFFGISEIEDDDEHHYKTEDAQISVTFSTKPCVKEKFNRGKFNIAKNTVLSSIIGVNKRIPLSEFDFDLDSYKKEALSKSDSGELIMYSYTYMGDDIKINLFVEYLEGSEYLKTIFINSTKESETKLRCSKIYETIK